MKEDQVSHSAKATVVCIGGRFIAFYSQEILDNGWEPFDQPGVGYMPVSYKQLDRYPVEGGAFLVSRPRNLTHRHFYYWCPNCRSIMHLETAEMVEDDERAVDVGPWGHEPSCPMCDAQMMDWDEIAARDPDFQNKGSWEDTERWRAKLKERTNGG